MVLISVTTDDFLITAPQNAYIKIKQLNRILSVNTPLNMWEAQPPASVQNYPNIPIPQSHY